jgi:hypothetical protein
MKKLTINNVFPLHNVTFRVYIALAGFTTVFLFFALYRGVSIDDLIVNLLCSFLVALITFFLIDIYASEQEKIINKKSNQLFYSETLYMLRVFYNSVALLGTEILVDKKPVEDLAILLSTPTIHAYYEYQKQLVTRILNDGDAISKNMLPAVKFSRLSSLIHQAQKDFDDLAVVLEGFSGELKAVLLTVRKDLRNLKTAFDILTPILNGAVSEKKESVLTNDSIQEALIKSLLDSLRTLPKLSKRIDQYEGENLIP